MTLPKRLMTPIVTGTSDAVVHNLTVNRYGKYYPRKTLEDQIIDLIAGEYPIILVQGRGGVGKSSLVYNLLSKIVAGTYQFAKKIDKVFWFSDADLPGELTLGKVISNIKFTCNIDDVSTKAISTVEEDFAKISRVFDKDKLSLIVIDNFETVTDPHLLHYVLNEIPNGCKVILTSKYALGHFVETGVVGNRLYDNIVEIHAPNFSLTEWRDVFFERCDGYPNIKNWLENISDIDALLQLIYKALDGNIFGMNSVISIIVKRGITDIALVQELIETEGLLKESFQRILYDSWGLLSKSAQAVLLASMLQGLSYLDFDFIQQITGIGGVRDNCPQLQSKLDNAVCECIDLNLMEREFSNGHVIYYIGTLVYNYISCQLKNQNQNDAENRINLNDFQDIIERWIKYYRDIASDIGFCYNDTKKMQIFDEPNKRASLMYVLNYCYENKRYEDYISISRDLRYFFYTRAIWSVGDACIHVKRANAAKELFNYLEEFEALIYYLNIASKYNQMDGAEKYIERVTSLCDECDIEKNAPESYFRYKHTMGLYCYSKADYQSAAKHWSDILDSTPLITENIHDIDAAKRWRLKCFLSSEDPNSEKIIKLCLELLGEAQKHHFERSVVDFSLIIVDEYLKLGNQQTALFYLDQIKELVDIAKDALYLARYYLYLALCYGETDEGIENLKKSIEHYKTLDIEHEFEKLKKRVQSSSVFTGIVNEEC